MAIGILGRKVGMTQIFDEAGAVIPVTVIQAGPCHVLQIRTLENDDYEAVQLGFLDKKRNSASRSERGHVAKLDSKRSKKLAASGRAAVAKADCEPKRFIRELRGPAFELTIKEKQKETDESGQEKEVEVVKEKRAVKVGDKVLVDILDGIKAVDVSGTSIGRGFTGVMVRHNFKGQRATHGVKKVHRHGGSFGWSQFPSRNFKGRRAAGQHGNANRTARNLRVIKIDAEQNILLVRGAVPGPIGGYLVVRQTKHVKPNVPFVKKDDGKKKKK